MLIGWLMLSIYELRIAHRYDLKIGVIIRNVVKVICLSLDRTVIECGCLFFVFRYVIIYSLIT